MDPVIIVHGGAWAIPDEVRDETLRGVKFAAQLGFHVLQNGKSALDAVEKAVVALEDNPVFDAGTGSVLNSAGEIEMDAMIMDGSLKTGGVSCIRNLRNPIKVARAVMEKSDHCLLTSSGANEFARENGFCEEDPRTLVTDQARREWETFCKYSTTVKTVFNNRIPCGNETVGAVALDSMGNVACATSTGGITAKRVGRVGDSPIVGCGGYADNEVGAVSCTGHGESITRVCLAHKITRLMSEGKTAQEATELSLKYMGSRVGGAGGAIAISTGGDFGCSFTTNRMAWAAVKDDTVFFGMDPS